MSRSTMSPIRAGSQPKPTPTPPAPGELDTLIIQAIRDLAVDTPYYSARLVGNRLELYLYGGRILTWPLPIQAETPSSDPLTCGELP